MAKRKKAEAKPDKAFIAFSAGCRHLSSHPLLGRLYRQVTPLFCDPAAVAMSAQAWANLVLTPRGVVEIHANRRRLASPDEWAYVIAHHLLHLGFGHHIGPAGEAWNTACDLVVGRFLDEISVNSEFRRPSDVFVPKEWPPGTERALCERFLAEGHIPVDFRGAGLSDGSPDIRGRWTKEFNDIHEYSEAFGEGLADAAREAVEWVAHRDRGTARTEEDAPKTEAAKAREWFMASYPLLGSLAAAFRLEESPRICQQYEISVAAVDAVQQVIYINTAAKLSPRELRFVIGHELLHVGLRHAERAGGRDPYLWNVACDYVVNFWLCEMGVGTMPKFGALLDPDLRGMSGEQIYDRIARDMRAIRKLASLRGIGLGDMIGSTQSAFWNSIEGIRLDEFYRSSLSQGLEYHLSARSGRGLLPEGLLEDIRALALPPIPWDVRLGQWFDEQFPPLEQRRSYARPSRRQGATPEVPRPSWSVPEAIRQGRTFGVIIDTSGSMPPALLGYALGAIASYAAAKDVGLVRLVYCDALPYDQGYVVPESLLGNVTVKGRGGTVLQPGVNLLERAENFPKTAPILAITDGFIDDLVVGREHAYLVPDGARLPFAPRGPVFFIKE